MTSLRIACLLAALLGGQAIGPARADTSRICAQAAPEAEGIGAAADGGSDAMSPADAATSGAATPEARSSSLSLLLLGGAALIAARTTARRRPA